MERPNDTIGDMETMSETGRIVLAGRYEVVRRLGEGGMGSVWLAEDRKLDNRKVAIKMLPVVLAGKQGAYRLVKGEAMMAMRLSHSNIATVRSFEEDDGANPFLVMDFVEGTGLDDMLSAKGALGEEETVKLLRPVAAALDYAHAQGVVHRDVKPGNVMVRKDGTPFILDFGIAREIQETLTRVTGKLSSGTLPYMSPEQLKGRAPKAAQDVYSFAAMAYECLTGHPPFSRGQIEWQIVNEIPEPLPKGAASEALRRGVMAGLDKAPEKRPASCAGVLGLGTGLPRKGTETELRAAGIAGFRPLLLARKKAVSTVSGAAAILLAVVVFAICLRGKPTPEPVESAEWTEPDAGGGAGLLAEGTSGDEPRENAAALVTEMPAEKSPQPPPPQPSPKSQPTLRLAALLNGKPVPATVVEGLVDTGRKTPLQVQLEKGKEYTFTVRYEAGGRRYEGRKTVKTTQSGRVDATVELRETKRKAAAKPLRTLQAGERKTFVLPGGAAMEMVWCPPGTFTMGMPPKRQGEVDAFLKIAWKEETQHQVTFARGFWMARTEVTQEQWESVMGNNPSERKGGNRPVERVSWNDAQAFCEKAGLALPTEAEWEYACRAGNKGDFGGTGLLDDMGWYNGNSSPAPHPVGGKQANAWGLHDMHGNVAEWCGDWYGDYSPEAAENPTGPREGKGRVVRGGSTYSGATACRSGERSSKDAVFSGDVLGFRVVKRPAADER